MNRRVVGSVSVAVALVAIVIVGVAALMPSERSHRSLPCLPAAPSTDRVDVVRGEYLRVESTGFPCAFTTSSESFAMVGLAAPSRQLAMDLGKFRVHRDGSYSGRFRIPDAVTIGPAYVAVNGGIYDRCHDIEQSGCPGVTADVMVVR